MRYGFVNNFSQALAADLAVGATTMSLDGGGALLADASTDYRYKLTLIQKDIYGTETHREIVEVTGVSGDDLTVVREQEGTTQLSPWATGTAVEARVTAGILDTLAPELMAFGPVDFSDAGSSATLQVPAGRKLFVDSLEVVPTQSGGGGSWTTDPGTPTLAGTGSSVAVSPDGTLVAIGSFSSPYLYIYNRSDWSAVSGIPTPSSLVRSLDWSPDGSLLAVGIGSSPHVRVYETSGWTEVSGYTADGDGYAVKFSPDGSLLAIGHHSGNNITVLNTADWTVVTGPVLPNQCTALDWNDDGTRLAAVHYDSPDLTVFDTSDWSTVAGTPTIGRLPYSIAYSDDGSQLAVGFEFDNTLKVFNTADWSEEALPTMPSSGGYVGALAWNPGDGTLAVGHDAADYVSILDPADWTLKAAPVLAGQCRGLAFNLDGSQLLAAHSTSPYFTASTSGGGSVPSINLGITAGSPDALLSGVSLDQFFEGQRMVLDVSHAVGVTSLYAEPASAETSGAPATLVVRGYTLEA